MKKVLRIGGYCRVSHDEQKKYGYSVQAQMEKIKKWCEEEECKLIDLFVDEGFTAGNMKRPRLLDMLDNLKDLDAIVFTRLDRFSRNVLEANKMLELLQKHNVALISIEEDDIDTSTADGMFMFQLKVSLAERELKKGSERIKDVFEYKIKQGQAIFGTQPFGYKVIKRDGGKYVGLDEEVKPIIEDIFEHFNTYHSVRKTMYFINEKYELNKQYKVYYNLLKNPYYAGLYKGNDNYCPPYITMEQFERNQFIIENNIRERKNKHVYIFSGLIKCDECGSAFVGQSTTSGKNKQNRCYLYRCNGAYSNLAKKCTFKRIKSERKFEKYLLENIETVASEYVVKITDIKPIQKNDPQKRIKEILGELDRLTYSYHKNRISTEQYDKDYEKLEKELKKLSMQKAVDVTHIKDFLNSDWKNIYNDLTKENKRALWRNLIKEIRIDKEQNISITFL